MATTEERFAERARALGVEVDITTYPEGTRTAGDAAAAIGCDVAQIVKSLVFIGEDADGGTRPLLALTSGANTADTAALAGATGVVRVRKADADEARTATGYAIGGTPPFGHLGVTGPEVLMDRDLLDHDTVWAAAGTPRTVFPIAPERLREVAGARVADFGRR